MFFIIKEVLVFPLVPVNATVHSFFAGYPKNAALMTASARRVLSQTATTASEGKSSVCSATKWRTPRLYIFIAWSWLSNAKPFMQMKRPDLSGDSVLESYMISVISSLPRDMSN